MIPIRYQTCGYTVSTLFPHVWKTKDPKEKGGESIRRLIEEAA